MKNSVMAICLTLLVGTALAAIPGLTPAEPARPDPIQLSVSRSASGPITPVIGPDEMVWTDNPDETLHYDGDHSSAIGLTNGGTFYGAARFTPTSTCTVKAVLFFQQGAAANDYIFIFAENNDTTPGVKLESVPYVASDTNRWKRIDLPTPLVIRAGTDFWACVRVTHQAGHFPLGCDAGPMVRDRGGFISTNGTRWQQLVDVNPSLNYNWNIRAVVHSVPGLAHDVGVSKIIAPGTNIGPGVVQPKARVVNFGTTAESNIPVSCWIDSAGQRVYSRDTTLAGPLAPGNRAEVTFPNWTTGPAGNSYTITMFTALAGDLDRSNDTSRQVTSIARTFTLLDHDTGYCKLTVSCLGSIGYDIPPTDAGSGFRYPKTVSTSALFFASLAVGNSINYVVDRYYSHPTTNPVNMDWQTVDSLMAIEPPLPGDEHFSASYTDAAHPAPKGLKVTQNSYMVAAPGYDDFVVLIYDIQNNGASPVNGLYAGVFSDFDVGSNPALNFSRSDTVRRLGYIWMQNVQNPNVGVKILEPRSFANMTSVDHARYVYPDSCVTDTQKFNFLSGAIVQRNSNRAYDWSLVLSVGPFDLEVGQSYRFAVAFVGGTDSLTIRANADSAQSWYDHGPGVAEKTVENRSRTERFELVPNPFTRSAVLRYFAANPGRLDLAVFDASGRLVDKHSILVKAGAGTYLWQPRSLSRGVYFLNVKAPGKQAQLKVLHLE